MVKDFTEKIPVVIAPALKGDIRAMVDLEELCFGESWTEESYLNEIGNSRTACYLVCRSRGKLAGFIGAWIIMDEAHITTVAVHPDMRGKRLGKCLIWCLMDQAVNRGCRWATLEVATGNAPARKLYERFGFVKIGQRKRYYANGEDAVVMWAGKIQQPSYREILNKIQKEWEEKICLSWESKPPVMKLQ